MKAIQLVTGRRLSLHPVKLQGKEPLLTSWPKLVSSDPTQIAAWEAQFPGCNFGAAASDEICILESDNVDELRNRISKQLPETYTVQARANRPHFYFRQTAASREAGNLDLPGIFEFKQHNRYVVAKGSIHPTGVSYICIVDAPIVEIPAWLVADLVRLRAGSGARMSASLPTDGRKYGEGEGRHPMLMSQAARMWDGQKTEEEMFNALQAVNERHCDPQKSAAHLMSIIEWVMQREPNQQGPVIVLNRKFKPRDSEQRRAMTEQAEQEVSRLEINLSGDNTEVLRTCAELLIKRDNYYQRGPELVEPITAKDMNTAGLRRDAASVVIRRADPSSILIDLQEVADFVKEGRGGLHQVKPPKSLGQDILVEAQRNKDRYTDLDMVTATPIMLPNHSVMEEPGFRDGVLFTQSKHYKYGLMPEPPAMHPDEVSDDEGEMLWHEAAGAIRKFYPLLKMFPFIEPDQPGEWAVASSPSYAVVLSAILSLVARPALETVPMHVFDAPTPGTGKTKCVELACLAATGLRPATVAYRDEDELAKTLTPLLSAGDRAILIDNVSRELNADKLNAILTSTLHKARILGHSETLELVNSAVFFATGNNIMIKNDLVRRSLKCTLNCEVENPQHRRFEFDPAKLAKSMHPELCMAALTALRCYARAGFPEPKSYQVVHGIEEARPPRLGSFEEWDKLVRGCIRWLGYADPVRTQAGLIAADPAREADLSLLNLWYAAVGSNQLSVYEIGQKREVSEQFARLHAEISGGRDWNPYAIATRLRKMSNRHVGGFCLRRAERQEFGTAWRVEKLG